MAGHPDEQMTIEVVRSDDGALITLVGELDLATASELYEVFTELQREGGVMKVEVNLAGLTFMDSTGISTLIMEQKRLRASGGQLTIIDPPHNVVRIFQVSGVDKLLLGAEGTSGGPINSA